MGRGGGEGGGEGQPLSSFDAVNATAVIHEITVFSFQRSSISAPATADARTVSVKENINSTSQFGASCLDRQTGPSDHGR